MTSKTIPGYEKITVTLTHDEQIIRILLATPPANILDGDTMAEIMRCLETEAASKNVKAIVFEGKGKHFCFGASVAEHIKAEAPKMINGFHGMFKKLLSLDIPLFAIVRGQCLGGGMELAAFCSFIIAEPDAKFGQPEIQLAVLAPVASAILPDIIGQARTDDLLLTGRSIDAETARAWGLVHSVAEDGEAALMKILEKHVLPKSASSLKLAAQAARWIWHCELPKRLDEMEDHYVNTLMETHDASEGIDSFLKKRKPEFKNE
jgi:cyclohexa-1,5-dienecarbonyl-CoA hydratase